MSVSALSASTSPLTVSSALSSSSASSTGLVKLANGEYAAASVDADPTAATKLDLTKEKDGNYGATPPSPSGGAGAAQSSSSVLESLTTLTLGGR